MHHILLYQCSSNLNDSVLDYGHECYHPNMPDSFFTCETVIFAWAIGGEVGIAISMLHEVGMRRMCITMKLSSSSDFFICLFLTLYNQSLNASPPSPHLVGFLSARYNELFE